MKKSFLMRTAIAAIFISQFTSAADAGYDVQKRFRLMEDKFQTEEFLREAGHDFLIDMSVYANTDLMDLVGDVSDASDAADPDQAAADVLSAYADTEQNLRVNVEVGVPLPSFNALKGTVSPSVRLGVKVGSLIGIGEEDIETDTLINAIPVDAETKTILQDKLTQSVLDGVLAGTTSTVSQLATALGLSGAEKTQFEAELTDALGGTAIPFAGSGSTAPIIDAYVKADVTAGINFDYKNERHFGGISLYGLYRADVRRVLDQDAIAGDGDVIDTDNLDQNMTLYAMADITYGFNWFTNFRTMFQVSDIAIATVIENDEGYLPLYEPEVGYRMHTDYSFNLSNMRLRPFVGFHMRDGYDFADGVYAGTDLMLHVWKERIALTVRGLIDSEHLTLSPRFRLGFMDFMYSLKQPIVSDVQGVKTSAIHSINFRLHF